jgi:hypothetical protein
MPEYDGSTPHYDAQREKFCQELIAGESLYASYETAGFKRPRGNAQRMQQEPEVAKRLEWLHAKVAPLEEALLGYRRLQHRRALEHIATADRVSLFEQSKAGRVKLKPLSKLTTEQRELIDNLDISDKGVVLPVIAKKLEARAMLAKLDGFDKPVKTELGGPNGGPLVIERVIVEHPAHRDGPSIPAAA